MSQKPTFSLFRSTSSSNRSQYVGSVVTPEGRVYAIEANVIEHERPDGTKGKHFAGEVFGGQGLVKSMLRGAKIDGQLPADLVTMMEDAPFNDPLPSLETPAAAGGSEP
ncbi:MAG TPA: hypothetical protein VNW92_24150 [Polyangiaceae bacterium]|nr:hypothetical protein [Polyangiaceae bacterium]